MEVFESERVSKYKESIGKGRAAQPQSTHLSCCLVAA